MTVEALKELLNAQPFVPFTLQLASGDVIPVPSTEFVLINPKTPRTIVVAYDEGFRVIDLLLVEQAKLRPPRRRAG